MPDVDLDDCGGLGRLGPNHTLAPAMTRRAAIKGFGINLALAAIPSVLVRPALPLALAPGPFMAFI